MTKKQSYPPVDKSKLLPKDKKIRKWLEKGGRPGVPGFYASARNSGDDPAFPRGRRIGQHDRESSGDYDLLVASDL